MEIKRHYLFFDCETGGKNPKEHSLLTACFSIYDNNLNLIDELYLQLKPEKVEELKVEQEALDVTGINLSEHLADPKTIIYREGTKQLIVFLEKHKIKGKKISYTPCGHNVDYDVNSIQTFLLNEEVWRSYVHYNTLDTLRILTFMIDLGFFPDHLGRLESLVTYFEIPMGETHNAREDVHMTVEVFKKMKDLFTINKQNFSNTENSPLLEIIERGV